MSAMVLSLCLSGVALVLSVASIVLACVLSVRHVPLRDEARRSRLMGTYDGDFVIETMTRDEADALTRLPSEGCSISEPPCSDREWPSADSRGA